MVIVMDMETGKKLTEEEAAAEEFGAFVDEVLNAGWLPQAAPRLEAHPHLDKPAVADADAFLRDLYRNQE
jgi:hypothetical protein